MGEEGEEEGDWEGGEWEHGGLLEAAGGNGELALMGGTLEIVGGYVSECFWLF